MANLTLFLTIHNLSGHNLAIDRFMEFAAVDLIYLAGVILLVLAITNHSQGRKILLLSIISGAIAMIALRVINMLYFEPRPFITHPQIIPLIKYTADASFPSFHTTVMAVLAFAFLYHQVNLTWIFILMMFLVGFARIYVGVHYPLDILGAMIVGLFSVQLGWWLKDWFKKEYLKI